MRGAELGVAAAICLTAFVALMVLLVVAGRRRARRRWAELHQWAQANGWSLTANPAVDWPSRLPGGNKRGVSLALYGRMWGRPTSLGEYSYTTTSTTGTNTTTTTHAFVVVVVHLDRPCGYLGVQPRGVLSRWGRALFGTGSAIGHEQFDKSHQVVGDPATAAYPLSPALIAAHVEGVVPPWTVYGHDLLTFYPGRLELARVAELAGPLHQVAALLTGVGAPR